MKKIAFLLILALFCALFSSCTGAPNPATTEIGTETDTTDGLFLPEPVIYDLQITEVMADNQTLSLGHDFDWVELHNREEMTVLLDGYYLTDDLAQPEKFSLQGLSLSADGYLAVELKEESFGLSSKGETVYLTFGGETVSELTFPATERGESFGAEGVLTWITPGFANTEEGYLACQQARTLPDLILNEVISSNDSHAPVNGAYYDVVEICNRSDAPLSLLGYTLTDKRSEPLRYAFPNVVLQPDEVYVVYCSGTPALGADHASFKISSAGETVFLAKDGVILDRLAVPADLKRNESFGRSGMSEVYFPVPTVGAPNGQGFATGVPVPTASQPSGVYSAGFSVTLEGPGTIYYTVDGTRPTTASAVYGGPIPVSGVMTIRAFCQDGTRSSSMTAFTYIIDKNHTLPVVSVAMPTDLLTGPNGILTNGQFNYEYDGIVTMIENGEEKFSAPVGFRLHGHGSRWEPKQNFQLRFRSEYGVGKLNYPLFENRPFDQYDSLLLKGGSEDWNAAMMRDEICTYIAEGTALSVQAIKPVVLYLGGEYWGVYFLRERFNDEYVEDHFDVDSNSVSILTSSGAHVECGSAAGYKEIKNFVSTHDMSLTENYQWLVSRIDANSLMDWYICRSYMGDKDTANVRRFQSTQGDGLWRWMYFDLDWAFYHKTDKPLTSISTSGGDHLIFRSLVASAEGKDAFLRRYAQAMKDYLNETNIISIIDTFADTTRPEVPADRARWGKTVKSWESAVERMRAYVRGGVRDERVKWDLKNYFGLSDAEMAAYFG